MKETIKVINGCRALNIKKGAQLKVLEIQQLGAEYSHSVRLVLGQTQFSLAGNTECTKKTVLYARHINRLADPEFNLNNGNPCNKIRVKFV